MTTYHAIQRTQERTGLNPKASVRFIENAIKRGRTAETLPVKVRKYLLSKEVNKEQRAVLYNTYCFIIKDGDCCITMFPLPKTLGKKRYHGKREIKNIKKYARYYNLFKMEDV